MRRTFAALPYVIVATWAVWVIGVLAAGNGYNVFGARSFDFALAGQFGDAFGSLSSLMATLAAAGAWYAVSLQRKDLSHQEIAREEDDKIRRQQAFEQNFFQLLGHLAAIVRETDIVSQRLRLRQSDNQPPPVHTGKDAFRRIFALLHQRMDRESRKGPFNPFKIYLDFYNDYQDDLGHYFRILYHICNYVKVQSDVDRSFYMKIIFAQLSNSELFLVGYNCAYGHGQRRFKPIVEEFSGLSNVGFTKETQIEESLFRYQFSASALPAATVS